MQFVTSVYSGDSWHSTEIPAWICLREEGRKPNPRTSLLSRMLKHSQEWLRSIGKHHLNIQGMSLPKDLRERLRKAVTHFFSDAATLCGFHLKIDTGVSLLALPISKVPLMFQSV